MSNRYVVRGNGGRWTVTIKRLGACEVLQLQPGEPIAGNAETFKRYSDRFLVHCLTCGDPILVNRDTAPICSTCRE